MATTWVQIIKAVLLLAGATFMAFVVLYAVRLQPRGAVRQGGRGASQARRAIMGPGSLVIKDPISAISLGMALMFGTAGLPHILMRFFTVPDAKEARKSVFWATGLIGYFYILTFIIGFGAIVLVLDQPGVPRCGIGKTERSGVGRRQHGGDPSGQRGRRQRVPRLHLGGGLRDHPGGGGRPDAGRRLGVSATTSTPP